MFEFLKNLTKIADGQVVGNVEKSTAVPVTKKLDSIFKEAWDSDKRTATNINRVKDDFKKQFPDMTPEDMAKVQAWLDKKLPKAQAWAEKNKPKDKVS